MIWLYLANWFPMGWASSPWLAWWFFLLCTTFSAVRNAIAEFVPVENIRTMYDEIDRINDAK